MTGAAVECGLSGIARDDGADGVARHAPLTPVELDGAALGARAAAKARASAGAIELAPGHYEVVLEPTAVADIVESLAVAGFNGKMVNERRSFVRLGDDQFDPAITLIDDPLTVGFGYDNEGTFISAWSSSTGHAVSLPMTTLGCRGGPTTTGHAVDMAFAKACARHLGILASAEEATVATRWRADGRFSVAES